MILLNIYHQPPLDNLAHSISLDSRNIEKDWNIYNSLTP